SNIREDGSFRIRVAPGRNYIYLRPGDNWRREQAAVTPRSRWVEVADGQTVEVEFKIRKYSQAELDGREERRHTVRYVIPKTVDEAQRETARMRRLGVAIRSYVESHDQTLPRSPLELKPYLANKEDLKWALDDVEYVMRGKLTQPYTAKRPIAYDISLLAKSSYTCALFADFSVHRIGRNDIEQLGVYYRAGQDTSLNDMWATLHTAMKMYAKEHDGKLPDTLDTLKPYVVSERYFEWIVKYAEYLSPGRHLGLMQNWALIACEKEAFAKDHSTTVLFADGHTESMYPKQIKKLAQLDRRAKESAERLMRIGRALLIYANDHDGKYPDMLHKLREYLKTEKLAWIKQYECLAGGRTTADRPDIVIVYDAELMQQGKGTNVLFNDCHVEFANLERLTELSISNTTILLKTRILTVTDDFLEDIRLDTNSVHTSELWSEHLLTDPVADPNSQPYRLILDDLTVNSLLKAIAATPEGKGVQVLAAPQVVALDGRQTVMFTGSEIPVLGTSEPNESGETVVKYAKLGTWVRLTPDALPDNENV
ncbi:MAG: hypothetical protein U9Q07_15165, partial [Planctomycetota bacterium]|nr:hypothetical protein [Planctomycetota bacterium]